MSQNWFLTYSEIYVALQAPNETVILYDSYMEKNVKRSPCPAFFLSFICENIFVQFVKIWWHFSRFIFSVWIRSFLIIWICCVLLLINKSAMNREKCAATGLGVMSTKKIADLRKSRTIWQNHGKIRQSKQKMYMHLR